jgi:serine protease Do
MFLLMARRARRDWNKNRTSRSQPESGRPLFIATGKVLPRQNVFQNRRNCGVDGRQKLGYPIASNCVYNGMSGFAPQHGCAGDPPAFAALARRHFRQAGRISIRWRHPTVAALVVWLLGFQLAAETPNPGSPAFTPTPSLVSREALPAAFLKEAPDSIEDLQTIQEHVNELLARVSPAVVAVRVGGSTGSGVVISEDGYVLCAAHVGGEADRKAEFIFPDGTRAFGKTLGANHAIDSGLMKIMAEGPWPHIPIGDLDQTRLGDWVLAAGHPGGFDRDRSMVVRLGRVITLSPGTIRTDCTLIGGDSGGPLFDMHGQVIGIHSRIANSMAANFHVPIRTFVETWDRLAKSEQWGNEPPSARPYVGARGMDHPDGYRLERVDQNGPAFKAGLRVGDLVLKVNEHSILDHASFEDFLSKAKPGDELSVSVKRDGTELSVTITVMEAPRRRRGR